MLRRRLGIGRIQAATQSFRSTSTSAPMHTLPSQPTQTGHSRVRPDSHAISTPASPLSFRIHQLSLQAGHKPGVRRLQDAPRAFCSIRESDGATLEGFNFTASDYLGLASHSLVKQAAIGAIHRFGTHGAGPAAIAGTLEASDALARDLGRLLHLPHVALFPSGWTAGYDAMRAFVRPDDVVLMDACISNGIRSGATASSWRIHLFRHLDTDHARLCLRRLRAMYGSRAIFVATSSLFPVDGNCADLTTLHRLCGEYNACLIVDAAHDFGCVGPEGAGESELQSVWGEIPIVIGSLSKCLASNGGFVATQRAETCDYLKARSPTHAFSCALSPAQVATAAQALAIIRSPEGSARRAALRRAVIALRAALVDCGIPPGGSLGPIVVTKVGSEAVARHAVRLCAGQGVLLSLLETPLVPRGKSRLRLQLMAGHEPALMPEIAKKISNAITEAHSSASRNDASRTLDQI